MSLSSNLLNFEATIMKRKRSEALLLFRDAYRAQVRGQFVLAVEKYKESIRICPTAEAYTFLGWTFSLMGNLELAIEQCENAIALDSEFGNPYNDIGAYMIALGDHVEAISYLRQALNAKRFRAHHYAYFNLGRASELDGDYLNALRYYKSALKYQPEYRAARFAITTLKRTKLCFEESLIGV